MKYTTPAELAERYRRDSEGTTHDITEAGG